VCFGESYFLFGELSWTEIPLVPANALSCMYNPA
jgi:hypothetical protein